MNVIEKLLSVQQRDCRIRELERESQDVPKRKADEQLRLKDHKEALAKAEDALKGKMAEIKNLEGEIEARKGKIAKLRTQQLDLKTNKEFKAIDSEIKTITDSIGEVEDKQLMVMELVEAARADVQLKKSALVEEDKHVQVDVVRLDQRLSEISAELKGLKEERAALAVGVEPKWLTQYERIIGRKDKGFVQIEEGVCGGCHMKLPPSVVHRTRRMEDIVICDFCGRMLYC